MKALLVLGSLLFTSMAFSETGTYDVSGMHCGACASAIESKVCKMDGVKTCKAEVVDGKKKVGKLTITTEEGKAIDTKKVEELVGSAGDYKLVQSKKK